VEKVAIVSKQKNPIHCLIALINELFPECETSIVFSDMESADTCPDESLSEFPFTDERKETMSDILIVHDQPIMHNLLSQKLAGAVKSL